MEKDFIGKGYTADAVINRGYAIYDEWEEKRLSSRKIVVCVKRAVAAVSKNAPKAASLEALAYLFALDTRIKEKYNTPFRCFFSYFSRRRETRALDLLKSTLCIPSATMDVRTAIEVKLQKLLESIEIEEAEGDDDETHGGKRNGMEEEVTEEKGQEPLTEEEPEEQAEREESQEAKEEQAEEYSEEATTEESPREADEQQQSQETEQEETESAPQDETEQESQEERDELKEESDTIDEPSEPSADKREEAKTYNDAIDITPIYQEQTNDRSAKEKVSFIDEVIMDNMVKGKDDPIRHNPLEDVKQNKENGAQLDDRGALQAEADKNGGKDAYLYDKLVMNDKGNTTNSTEKNGNTPQTETVSEATSGKPEDTVQNPVKDEAIKKDFEKLRVPLQVDMTQMDENEMRRELNDSISKSEKAVEEFHKAQMEAMREQMRITDAEFGINTPNEPIESPDIPKTDTPNLVPGKK